LADAFGAARQRLMDYRRQRRGEIKSHAAENTL